MRTWATHACLLAHRIHRPSRRGVGGCSGGMRASHANVFQYMHTTAGTPLLFELFMGRASAPCVMSVSLCVMLRFVILVLSLGGGLSPACMRCCSWHLICCNTEQSNLLRLPGAYSTEEVSQLACPGPAACSGARDCCTATLQACSLLQPLENSWVT